MRHKYHLLTIFSAPVIFLILFLFTSLNPIYSTIIALFGGGVFTWYCRPDLKTKMFFSGLIFLTVYFVYFLFLVLLFPKYVETVWNLPAISGILILGVPLEELLFAFAVGFLWSSIYEHLKWRRLT
ncbi:MAG: lycopene cyclase domain-containing protein [Patescibacteria group bacterium]|nr:lycopene cyclase domain-containing protein [Patescibacteria group bacterium]